MKEKTKGKLTIICGPMFSGKTEELIRLTTRFKIANKQVAVFKPKIDNRYNSTKVCSHSGSEVDCILINRSMDIIDYLNKYNEVEYVGIDEIQFLDNSIIDIVSFLIEKGYNITASGLDMDFRGEPFGPMPKLLCIAEAIQKLKAVCNKCGEDAPYTQRIIDGRAASYNDPIILVGSQDSYEARCRDHHEVLDRIQHKQLILNKE